VDAALFYLLAATALVSALVVVAQPNPIRSALALIVTLCSLAGIFGLLGSPFIAALQVIVYAGAIMVLFLFVLMLLNVEPERGPGRSRQLTFAAVALAVALSAQLGSVLVRGNRGAGAEGFSAPSLEMARVLFSSSFLYAFEAVAVLILAALVGSVVLAKRELP
jgi:NADH-quinone oxidoreductase subunit J